MTTTASPQLSIVIPLHNEVQNIPELFRRLLLVVDQLNETIEIICVDDGSTDQSAKLLRQWSTIDPRIGVIFFTRNFGHQAALAAGLQIARGQAVVCLDGDLQHPPEMIPQMIAEWHGGKAVVHLAKKPDCRVGWLRRIFAWISYTILLWISDTPIIPNASDFYLLDRQVVTLLNSIPGRTRFYRGLIHSFGLPTAIINFTPAPRFSGKTTYRLRQRVALIFDGIITFSRLPLRLASFAGFFISVAAFVYGGVVIWQRLTTNVLVSGWATLVVLVLFLGGVQLITVGIIGEYLGKLYTDMRGWPTYVVREKLGVIASSELEDR